MIRVLCYWILSCYQKLSYGLWLLWAVWALTPWVNLQIMFSYSSCLVGNNVVWICLLSSCYRWKEHLLKCFSRVDFALSEKVLWPAVLSTLFWQHCSGKSRSDIYTLYGLTLACCQMRTSFLKHKSRMLRDSLSEALLLSKVRLVDSNILLAIT